MFWPHAHCKETYEYNTDCKNYPQLIQLRATLSYIGHIAEINRRFIFKLISVNTVKLTIEYQDLAGGSMFLATIHTLAALFSFLFVRVGSNMSHRARHQFEMKGMQNARCVFFCKREYVNSLWPVANSTLSTQTHQGCKWGTRSNRQRWFLLFRLFPGKNKES